MDTCFVCRKHMGLESAPPGGYIYEDEHWMVCHAPVNMGPLGTLLIESNRHFLDYAEMTTEETATLTPLMKKIYNILRTTIDAERIYQISMMDGAPHLHIWLVPRGKDVVERGIKFLTRDESCSDEDAAGLAYKLREAMK
jgi:diadenosine tetraphosphate (Ap4A) HIT family hydrolase